jgi:Tol biopolymer transport system component
VSLLPDEPWTAELVPASALEPEATYELVVTTEVRDLDGDALEAPHTAEFTTATATEPSTAPAIAFHSTRDGSYHIYVADADGSHVTRLVEGSYPAWSWDGRGIAFNRSGEWSGELSFCGGISVMDADGFGVTPLYDWASDGCEVLAAGMPAWSPDDRTIAFHGQSPDPGAWILDTGIFVMNTDGSDVRLLLSDTILRPDYTGFGHPTWSPDGQSIAVTADSEDGPVVIIMGASDAPLRSLSAEGWSRAPAWSPDGSRIAAIQWNLEDSPAIVSYDVTSGDREILFRYPEAQSSDFHEHLDWSPDGRHIVFTMRTTSEQGSGTRTRIFILTLETGEVRQLIPDAVGPVGDLYEDGYPVWSRAVR